MLRILLSVRLGEKRWGLSIKEKSRIAAMIEKERMEASQRRGSYEW